MVSIETASDVDDNQRKFKPLRLVDCHEWQSVARDAGDDVLVNVNRIFGDGNERVSNKAESA